MKLNKHIHKRYARNFLLFPQFQLKYAFINLAIFMIGLGILCYFHHLMIQQIMNGVVSPDTIETIQQLSQSFNTLELIVVAVTGLMIFAITIVVTHRFLGPMVPMIRYFKDLEENKPAKLHLRKEDALYPLAETIQNLEITVSKRSDRNEKGFTVLEVLVSLFILSIVLVGFAGSLSVFNNDVQKVKVQSTRTDLTTLIRTNTKDFASLYNSSLMPENTALFNCLNGASATACTNYAEVPFNYYSSLKTVPVMDTGTGLQAVDALGQPIFNPEMVAGIDSVTCPTNSTSQSPVFYNKDGRRCSCSDSPLTCPIQAVVKYVAFCANGATTCAKPSGVKILFQLKNRSDLPTTNVNSSSKFSEESGQFFMSLEEDDQYYLKFSFASSYLVDIATGKQTISASVSEFDIKEGKALTYTKPAALNINFSFSAPENVSQIKMSRYVYPAGCTLSNLGGPTTVAGTAVDCTPPTPNQYVVVQTVNVTPTKVLIVSTADNISSDSVVDYKLIAYNSANGIVLESKNNLRAFYNDDAILSVVPPTLITFVCDPTSTANTFVFTASAFNGWKTLTAKLNPPGQYSGVSYTDLPGFENFNKNSQSPQNIVVDSKYFTPGINYDITFEGVTNDDISRVDKKTFTVGSKPAEVVNVDSPASGSIIRTQSDLNLVVSMNLACGKTVKSLGFNLKKVSGNSAVSAISGLETSCVAATGAVDENKFTCTQAIPCQNWLNVTGADQCLGAFSNDTDLIGTATVVDNLNKSTSGSTTFTAGTKISAYIMANFVQWVRVNYAGVNLNASTTPVDVSLSSPLLTGESIPFTLSDGAGTTHSFTCALSGGSGSTYNSNSNVCTLNLPTPSGAAVYTLDTTEPTHILIQSPNTVTFKLLDSAVLACSAQVGHPVCSGGQTLKQRLDVFGTYDFTWDNGIASLSNYSIVDPTAAVDFFIYYQPKNKTAPSLSVVLTAQLASGVPGVSNTYISKLPATPTAPCTTGRCPGDYVQIPASIFESGKVVFGANAFSTAVSSSPTTSTNAKTSTARIEMMLMRQCYCQ